MLALSASSHLAYFRPALLHRVEPVRWALDSIWALQLQLAEEREVVLGEDVAVSPSPGKGQGVFALRCIDDGALVSRYEGIVRTTDDSNRARVLGRTSNEYALNLDVDEAGNGWVVDAEFSERSGWQRYINHSVRRANCELAGATTLGRRYCTYFRAKRSIAVGEELLFDYGQGYWDVRVGRWNLQRFAIDYL